MYYISFCLVAWHKQPFQSYFLCRVFIVVVVVVFKFYVAVFLMINTFFTEFCVWYDVLLHINYAYVFDIVIF